MKKRCLVNLVTSQPNYVLAQDRLINRMLGQSVPLLTFRGVESVGAPPHQVAPFAFKLYAIRKVVEKGYEQVFWVDSCVWPVMDIEPIFTRLDNMGIFLEDSGHKCGKWMRQESLDYFGVTREEADKIPMISAGFVGFDFTKHISQVFFKNWWQAMEDGMFEGCTIKYRSEQGAASLIAHKLGLSAMLSRPHDYFCYVGEQYGEPNPTAPFHLQGL